MQTVRGTWAVSPHPLLQTTQKTPNGARPVSPLGVFQAQATGFVVDPDGTPDKERTSHAPRAGNQRNRRCDRVCARSRHPPPRDV